MIDTVLIPVDGSDQSVEAVRYTDIVFPEADIVLLTVIDPVSGFAAYDGNTSGNWEVQARNQAKDLLTTHRDRLSDPGSTDTRVTVGSPSEQITGIADAVDADQIVMGSHGRSGVQRLLVGSVAEQVMRSTSIPVTIVR
jgi:nucleotide-binding universal stress UspA family protein